MKNLEILVNQTKSDFDKLNIKYGKVAEWKINTRAKKRWGQCKRVSADTFEINISARLLQDRIDDQIPKNVIAHELLHTVKGCFAHRGKWKELSKMINSSLKNYNIKATDNFEEIATADSAGEPKYKIQCTLCDFSCIRYKKSKVIKHTYLYRCPKCGGELKIKVLDKNQAFM